MKKIFNKGIAVLLCITVLALCAVSASALDGTSLLKYSFSTDGYATVTDCSADANGAVVVPSEVECGGKIYTVKYIGEKAFDKCYNITEIHIPEGVTAIKNFAFRDCVSLTDVYVPESLVMCRYDAFEGCGKLTVHCYSSSYQLFASFSGSANIDVVLIGGEAEDDDVIDDSSSDVAASGDLITRMIEALKNFINNLKEYFGADDEFDFPFAEEFPFVDDLIDEFEKI